MPHESITRRARCSLTAAAIALCAARVAAAQRVPAIDPPNAGAVRFDAEQPHHIVATPAAAERDAWPIEANVRRCTAPCTLSLPPGRWRIYTRTATGRIEVNSSVVRDEPGVRVGPTPRGSEAPQTEPAVRRSDRVRALQTTGFALSWTGLALCGVDLVLWPLLFLRPAESPWAIAALVVGISGVSALAVGGALVGVGSIVHSNEVRRSASASEHASVRWAPSLGVRREGAEVGVAVAF